MNKIFSLHIGINNYHPKSNVPALYGCVNDVEALKNCLDSIFPTAEIHSKTLLNEDATYQNVINHFGEKHLLQADANDTVLIQYAGHGSQSMSAPEFAKYFPDKKDETMICYDSRVPGGLDLADKELCILIDRIAAKKAHVVVVMDCCHSGSVTRHIDTNIVSSIVPRQYLSRSDERSLQQYAGGYFAEKFGDRTKIVLPNPKHILLAACDRTETAGEINGSGIFTTNLIKVLEESKGNLSYANLFAKVRLHMAKMTSKQHPQFEPSGFFNPQTSFLKNTVSGNERFWQLHAVHGNWIIDRGIIHGLSADPGKKTIFEIYDQGTFLGRATANQVMVEDCMVALDCTLDGEKIYDAKMISFAEPSYLVQLQTNQQGNKRLAPNLKKYTPVSFELQQDICADYCMEVTDREVRVIRTADSQLIRCINGTDEQKIFQDAFELLEVIANREKLVKINNKYREIKEDVIELELTLMNHNDIPVAQKTDAYVKLPIKMEDGNEVSIPFFLTLHNNHPIQDLYCALYYFSESFDVLSLYNSKIPARKKAVAVDRGPDGEAPSFHLNNKESATDIFKLFVSTRPIRTFQLESQNNIEIGKTVTHNVTRSAAATRLTNERAVAFAKKTQDKNDLGDDWFCKTMEVVSIKSAGVVATQDSVRPIPEAKVKPVKRVAFSAMSKIKQDAHLSSDTQLSSTFNILPHSKFNAVPKIASMQVTRGGRDINSLLQREENRGVSLLNLNSGTRGAMQPVLEISGFSNPDIFKEEPLQIQIKNAESNTMLFPFTFDGEHILPIGTAENDADGNTLVKIHNIPKKTFHKDTVTTRSLTKAVKLYFLKTVMQKSNVSKLQWVDFSSGKPERKSGGAGKVAAANKIVLVVHGIMGDTKTIIPTMKPLIENGTADLILTFDYENLNTPLEQSAMQLKNALNHIGINENSNKKLTVVAHSMGGLVSRYFVEKLGGNKVVDRMIMAGTPNMGSNISSVTKIRSWASTLFALAANTGISIPASAGILTVLNYTKKLTITLEQMNGDSSFMKDLAASGDPGIPYHIIAGDFEKYCKECGEKKKLIDKLYEINGSVFFRNDEHDIAVSVSSIEGVNASRNPQPTVEYVSCHHLNYFTVEKSLDKILHWVGFEDPMAMR